MEEKIVERYIKDFDAKAQKAIEKNVINKSYEAIRISADIQYKWNQRYTDDLLENCIQELVDRKKDSIANYEHRNNIILFYDGFGLDTRGLALIYIKALCDLQYTVVYVVSEKSRYRQEEIHKVTTGRDIVFCYLENERGDRLTSELLEVFKKYRPQAAFFYTYPSDVEACVAFAVMAEKVKRYQINLTDHAFWLGRNAFDYCVEFREYGACVSYKYRRIDANKIKLLHFYPFFDRDIPFDGFPFEAEGKYILFSGGGLYKTYDDKGTYYHMVEEIMRSHENMFFVYAGAGDTSGLKKLQKIFHGRVFHITERKDLYAVIKHSTLYLNTYPITGGLMTQYAAVAGRLPLTLLSSMDSSLDGLLLNHTKLNLEFSNKEDLISEVDKLLCDENYRRQQEYKVKKSVIDEKEFKQELSNLLKLGETKYRYNLNDIDTEGFCKQYIHRFTWTDLSESIINRQHKALWWKYPKLFIIRVFHRLSKYNGG